MGQSLQVELTLEQVLLFGSRTAFLEKVVALCTPIQMELGCSVCSVQAVQREPDCQGGERQEESAL